MTDYLRSICDVILKYSGTAHVASVLRRRRALRFIRNHFDLVINLAAKDSPDPYPSSETEIGRPLFSIVVPVFNARARYLDDLLSSFQSQQSGLGELILSDDGSSAEETRLWLARHANSRNVTIHFGSENKGIAAATNAGIARATGCWVGLVDHDDALAPFVFSRLLKALRLAPDCRFLYTDEVITDRHLRPVDYFLKPAWDPVLLSGVNYINHLSLYKRDRLLAIGGIREDFEGSQDFDLLLRYTSGLQDREILHLPYPGYLWRRGGESYSTKFLTQSIRSARKALAQHYQSEDETVSIDQAVSPNLHRVRFDSRSDWPLVSVVIPSRNALSLISNVLDGLTLKTDYPSLEIIVVDNGTTDVDVLALYDRYRQGAIAFRTIMTNEPFNFSRSINAGIAASTGEYVLLLNNDIEVLDSGWLKEMASCFQYPRTAIVGAKLLYPDRSLQHAGVIAGLGGLAGHWFIGREEDFPGPMGRLWVRQSLTVVTGACMLLSRKCVDAVGKFDEERFPVAYNDVDYCLRAVEAGFRVVWTPFAKLVHHESASRGSDELPENVKRFENDKNTLRDIYATDTFEDRAFNPWLEKGHSEPKPARLDVLPTAR